METEIYFWSDERYRMLSNVYVRTQECRGLSWMSNEHFYHGMKTQDLVWRERVRKAVNPGKARHWGRRAPLRPDWDTIKFEIMREGLRAKFVHPDLKAFLLATGDAELYEDSPCKVWGTGNMVGKGPGKNILGQLLMELRKEFRTA
jgi:ribA/ribD-fused uncharacterized protein